MKNRTTHYFKPMLCGAWGCVRASVLAFLKQGSSLQQYLIAVVVETAEVYAKMAHNVEQLYAVVCRLCAVGKLRIGAVSSSSFHK